MREKTIQEYCRAIDKIGKGSAIRSKELCMALGLSKNTVAATLRKLSEGGFVEMTRYGKASLSPAGAEIARRMNFKHRVLETFMAKELGMDPEKVHAEADALEHAASDELIERLYLLMGKPKADPHGRPIR